MYSLTQIIVPAHVFKGSKGFIQDWYIEEPSKAVIFSALYVVAMPTVHFAFQPDK